MLIHLGIVSDHTWLILTYGDNLLRDKFRALLNLLLEKLLSLHNLILRWSRLLRQVVYSEPTMLSYIRVAYCWLLLNLLRLITVVYHRRLLHGRYRRHLLHLMHVWVIETLVHVAASDLIVRIDHLGLLHHILLLLLVLLLHYHLLTLLLLVDHRLTVLGIVTHFIIQIIFL